MGQRTLQERMNTAWPAGTPVATTAQLAGAGVGDRVLAAALKQGNVYRLRRGAYVLAEVWQIQKPWERDKLRLLAHIVTAPGSPRYSYFSAARLHGLFIWNCGPKVHVSSISATSGTGTPKDVVSHHDRLAASDLCSLPLRDGRNVTATTLERTVVDCARTGRFAEAVVIGDSALHRGARIEVMWAMVAAFPGRRGVRRAARVLQALDGRSESPGESRTRLIIVDMDIPQPELQLELWVDGHLYRPDFAWRDRKVIVEFDGDTKYFDFGPTPQVLLAERKREKRLMEAGWRFVRLEWKDLSSPGSVKARILAALTASEASAVA
ncbi:type IV toxin-antitoxin system AbiEi family antitoxin domain-containing protein [Arthrobacter wenxiniae]|jgi:hypothetical protein|uniref:Transcriptional regulator, AbiEi antitoxin, Type IV TA system n=1 Tax=Arthrobacter wenxiniae TaxID=2713570 RepID=A0A7Y7IHA0_9MICC|nr:type IV toxin-antitoxin system AbiEi family antitoxin domain-containing protein [Arthrobacter wenxiniae]NVM95464.1 hypothetical protein [Arthrobacter wenxiniae]